MTEDLTKITSGYDNTRFAAPHIAASENKWQDADRHAFALRLIRDHGDDGAKGYAVGAMCARDECGDGGGASFWLDIVRRVDQILRGERK